MTPRNITPKAVPNDDEPSIVEQMADDAAPPPTDYPPGAPEFKVLLAVRPRSRRAEFKRLLAQISEKSGAVRAEQAAMSKIKDDGAKEAAGLRMWASMDELYELIENALRMVAVDVEKFDAWAADDSTNDEILQTTWVAYQQRTQPGEASSSTS